MSRQYLTEDLAQIRRYFPGAKPVAIHTPFGLAPQAMPTIWLADTTEAATHWAVLIDWHQS